MPDSPSDNQPPLMPPVPAGANQPTAAQSAAAAAPTPELADDGDLIEKEWVQQVKHIVSVTGNDPYEQSAEFTRLKATYLQKRYGKQLKTD